MDKFSQQVKSTFLGFFEWVSCWRKGTKKEQDNPEEIHFTTTKIEEREFEVEAIARRGPTRPGVPRGRSPQNA